MRPRQCRRVQAGGVDEQPRLDLVRLGTADAKREAARDERGRFERRAQREHAAGMLEVAEVGEHQGMAVDDAGDAREQRRLGLQGRLQRACFLAAQPAQALDAVRRGALCDRAQLGYLARAASDDELAATAMADAAGLAIRVQRPPAGDAERGLQRARRVIQAGVDDLAVARAGAVADAAARFEHERFPPVQGELARAGEADHARADDDGIDPVHVQARRRARC